MMTTKILENNLSFLTNTKGEQVAVVIDLKSQEIRDYFEDLIDSLTIYERQDDESVDFFEATSKILANRKKDLVNV
jgi:RNase adaptor protein for sRNA GlmZ degradation